MSRKGRTRAAGHRQPNGQLSRSKAVTGARSKIAEQENVVALRQPHRRGDADQLRECPLGRLLLRRRLRRELYDAGIEYGKLIRRYFAAKGIPLATNEGDYQTGPGAPPSAIHDLEIKVDLYERRLKAVSGVGLRAVQTLAVYEMEIAASNEPAAIAVLFELAVISLKIPRTLAN